MRLSQTVTLDGIKYRVAGKPLHAWSHPQVLELVRYPEPLHTRNPEYRKRVLASEIMGDESSRKAEQVNLSEEKANPPSPAIRDPMLAGKRVYADQVRA